MADRIDLGTGVVKILSQFTVEGKEEVVKFINTLNSMTRKNNFAAYWKEQSELVRDVTEAYKDFNKTQSGSDAAKLINSLNALKAVAGDNIKELFSDYDKITTSFEAAAHRMGTSVIGEMSPEKFKEAFSSFEMLQAYGLNTAEIFKRISTDSDVDRLRKQVEDLTGSLARTMRELERVRSERDELLNGSEIQRLQEIEEAYTELIRKAKDEFASFLSANDLDSTENPWGRFYEYFEYIADGTYTAKEAIAAFRTEYGHLLEGAQAGDTIFSSTQMQEFIGKLEEACTKIEQMRGEIQSLVEGAALRQFSEEMAASGAITDRQRDGIAQLVSESGGLSNVAQLLVELIKNFDATEQETIDATRSMQGMLDTLEKIGNVGTEGLAALSKVFENLGYVTRLTVDEKQFSKLRGALDDIGKVENLPSLQALTNISLSGFDNVRISKASLSNLAEFLPEIAKADIDKLKGLSDINLSGFNGLSVKKPTVDNLKELLNAIGELTGKQDAAAKVESAAVGQESQAFKESNRSVEEHVKLFEAAIKAEQEKAKTSESVSSSMAAEHGAIDKSTDSVRKHADAYADAVRAINEYYGAQARVNKTPGARDDLALTETGWTSLSGKFAPLAEELNRVKVAFDMVTSAENRAKMSAEEQVRINELLAKKQRESGLAAMDAANKAADAEAKRAEKAKNREAEQAARDEAKATAELTAEIDKAHAAFEKMYESRTQLKSGGSLVDGIDKEINNLLDLLHKMDDNSADSGDAGAMNARKKAAEQFKESLESVIFNIDELHRKEKEGEQASEFVRKANEQYDALTQKLQALGEEAAKIVPQETQDRIKELFDKLSEPGDFTARKQAWKDFQTYVEAATGAIDKHNKAEQDADAAAVKKNQLLTQAEGLLQRVTKAQQDWSKAANNSATSAEYGKLEGYKSRLSELINQLNAGEIGNEEFQASLRQLNAEFAHSTSVIKSAGGAMQSWFSKGLSTLGSRLAYTLSMANIVMKTVAEVKKMISTAVELDTAMNQLQIVTRGSAADMEAYMSDVSRMAKETAQSTKDLIDATTVYARLGYTMDESAKLAKYTAMLQGVGDVEASTAQNAMTAVIKAFGVKVDEIESVMDMMVKVGNNFPISVSQLAEGMNNAGSMLAVSGNKLDESIALLTAANTTVQNISKASTGLRTIAARIRKNYDELDELGETIDNEKYEEFVKILSGKGMSLTNMNGEFRSTYDILKDISTVWGELTTMQQNTITEVVSGTRQQNVFASIVTQFGEAEGAMAAMADSAGELEASYSIYMESIQAHVNQLKAAYDELAMTFTDSDFAKGAIDFLTNILELLTALIDKVGVLTPLLAGGAIFAFFQNFDRPLRAA